MSGLRVGCEVPTQCTADKFIWRDHRRQAWRVEHVTSGSYFGWPFARQKDADHAMAVMIETGIDWTQWPSEVLADLGGKNGMLKLERTIMESLAW